MNFGSKSYEQGCVVAPVFGLPWVLEVKSHAAETQRNAATREGVNRWPFPDVYGRTLGGIGIMRFGLCALFDYLCENHAI